MATMLNATHTHPTRLGFTTVLAAALFTGALGCGGGAAIQPAQAPVKQSVLIARSCEGLKEQASKGAPVAVFVEIADVLSPLDSSLRERLAAPVEVDQVAGVLIDIGKPTSGPWNMCVDAACAIERKDTLSVRMNDLPTDPSAPMELELELGKDSPKRATIRTGSQEPALAVFSEAPGRGAVVVTPYYLFEPKDESLRLLQKCKSQRDSAE